MRLLAALAALTLALPLTGSAVTPSEPVPLTVDGVDVADLPALPEVARDPGTAASAESGSES